MFNDRTVLSPSYSERGDKQMIESKSGYLASIQNSIRSLMDFCDEPPSGLLEELELTGITSCRESQGAAGSLLGEALFLHLGRERLFG